MFEQILDAENIKTAIWNSSKGKRKREDVKRVIAEPNRHIEIIQHLLTTKTWRIQNKRPVKIIDGCTRKVRYIIKPDYRYDQIIHHAIIQVLSPIFMKGMYEYNCASVPKRGAHLGKRYIEKFIKENPKDIKYVLKLDIQKFFDSVPHDVLKKMLSEKFHDEDLLWLLFTIIDVTEKGIPLGYYTSQWFANWLLQGLDHYIKEQLHAKCYVRYMDDMVIFGSNKKELHKMLNAISDYLESNFKLKVKANWQVYRFDYIDRNGKRKGRSLDFMGFQFYRDKTILRKTILMRMTRKAKKIYKKEKPTVYELKQFTSYIGWLNCTDTYNMYLERIKPYISISKCKKRISNSDRNTIKRSDNDKKYNRNTLL